MPTVRNKDIGSWSLSLKEMNETFNERYIFTARKKKFEAR